MDIARIVILGILLAVVAYFLFGREGLNGVPNTIHMRIKINVFFFNIMDRIFPSREYEDTIRNHLYFSALKNETRSASFYVKSDEAGFVIKTVKIKDFHKRFSKKVKLNDSDIEFYFINDGDVQKTEKASECLPVKVPPSNLQGIYVTVKTNESTVPGDYRGEILIETNCGYFTVPIFMNVSDVTVSEEPSPALSIPDIDEKNGYLGYRLYPLMKRTGAENTDKVPMKTADESSLAYQTYMDGERDIFLYDMYIEKLEQKYTELQLENEIDFGIIRDTLTSQLFLDAETYENENERYLSAWKIMAEEITSKSKALAYFGEPDFRESRYYVKLSIYAPAGSVISLNGKAVAETKRDSAWALYEYEVEAETGTNFYSLKCDRESSNVMLAIMKPKIIE